MDLSRPLRVVTPSVDADVLAVLASAEAAFTGREVHRIIGRRSQSGVNRVLHRLVREGIVARTQVGSASSYQLNREHLQAEPVIALVRARDRLIERLERRFSDWTVPAQFAAMFGSSASGGHTERSDVDLLVVRAEDVHDEDDRWRNQLVELRLEVGRWTGNRADLLEYSMDEIEAAFDADDPFIAGLSRTMVVLHGPRSYLHRPRRGHPATT